MTTFELVTLVSAQKPIKKNNDDETWSAKYVFAAFLDSFLQQSIYQTKMNPSTSC